MGFWHDDTCRESVRGVHQTGSILVALTALEGSVRVTYRLSLLKKGSDGIPGGNLDQPFAETEHLRIPIGLNENLGEAMKDAVRQALKFLSKDKRPALTAVQAMACLSATTDFQVTQVVEGARRPRPHPQSRLPGNAGGEAGERARPHRPENPG